MRDDVMFYPTSIESTSPILLSCCLAIHINQPACSSLIANETMQNNFIVEIKLKLEIPYARARILRKMKETSIIRLVFNFSRTSDTNTRVAEMKLVASQGRSTLSISPVFPHPGPKRNSVKLGKMKNKMLKEKHKTIVE